MKKWLALLLCALMVLSCVACKKQDAEEDEADYSFADGDQYTEIGGELNVLNWGEYIDPELISLFEKETGVKVNYTEMTSNEEMLIKLRSADNPYDMCFPSDYIIEKLIKDDLLMPLDMSKIPNKKNIADRMYEVTNTFDPGNKYSLPYMWGTVGILYNTKMVDEEVDSWDILWNEKYAGKIVQYNNPRDAFGTAMFKLGIDVNTTDKADWDRCYEELAKERPLVYSYVMDEIYNMMESGEAAVGSYYAGDYFTMLDAQAENVYLRFFYPDPTNYYVDAMCIPSCAQNKEVAEAFINFMLSRDPAVANAEYTYYASPNKIVYTDEEYLEDLGEETIEILYPGIESFAEEYNKYAYRNLSPELLDYINTLWENVKIN